jgi:signal transduction histidine kinase
LILRRKITIGVSIALAGGVAVWVAFAVSFISALALGAYLLVFIAVLNRIISYQGKVAQSAVLEERRRLARDYHDGLAQELAYMVPRLRTAAREHPSLEPLRAAAERAMMECRLAIEALTLGADDDLSTAVVQTAETIAEREGTRLELDVKAGVRVRREARDALVRIASEAVTNAARHGHAETIQVGLRNGREIVLRIHDDGVGFETSEIGEYSGFGLVSMRQRVQRLGGEFHVSSEPGSGTLVEVRIP